MLDKLKELGKETKLTTTEVLEVIKSIGTPDQIVKDYSAGDPDFYNDDNPLIPSENSKQLKRTISFSIWETVKMSLMENNG